MVKIKKDGLKNIFCATCKSWMTEFYVSRHLYSKSHFTKKHFEKKIYKRKSKLSTCSTTTQKFKTPERKEEYEYEIKGDTIKKCRHNHESVFEDCSDASQPSALDEHSSVKKELFENQETVHNTFTCVPQNQLGLLDLNGTWDFLFDDENGASSSTNAGQSTEDMMQTELNSSKEFPTEILSGVFPECTDQHDNQMSFHKCQTCNPTTYKDYEDW